MDPKSACKQPLHVDGPTGRAASSSSPTLTFLIPTSWGASYLVGEAGSTFLLLLRASLLFV